MLGYISEKWQRKIALLFYILFCCQYAGYAAEYGKFAHSEIAPYQSFNSQYRVPKAQYVDSPSENIDDFVRTELEGTSGSSIPRNANDPYHEPEFGGPGQPEMSRFKSVGADNMVNLFSGDFSYNIPLLDVGGYPVNIFYNAGVTSDQEATWVGLGWNLNPGTISRNMRGIPDDFDGSAADGDIIKKEQSVKQDLTVGIDIGANTEITGSPFSIGAKMGLFWNNRRGLGIEIGNDFSVQKSISSKSGTDKTATDTGAGPNLKASIGMNVNSQSGLSLTTGAGLEKQLKTQESMTMSGLSTSIDYNSRQGLGALKIESEAKLYTNYMQENEIDPVSTTVNSANITFARSSFTPSIRMPMSRFNGNLKIKAGGQGTVVFPNGYISGFLSKSYIDKDDKVQTRPAFGFMNYEKANGNQNAMLDFNRINDGTYTLKTPVISIPSYTYDVFSISGEGTGGTFRGYRGNIGFVRDNKTSSKEGAFSLTLDVGAGFIFHGGTEIGGVYSKTEVGDWEKNNALRNSISFNNSQGAYEGAYFKNPGEKAIIDEEYYNTIGGDKLVRPKLTSVGFINLAASSVLPLPKGAALPQLASAYEMFDANKKYVSDKPLTQSNSFRKVRDKRTQIITSLKAEEAERVGLDKFIYSYRENQFFSNGGCMLRDKINRYYRDNDMEQYRKRHHFSEIDVLEGDGKRYVYGLPVYSIEQKDVSFSLGETQTVDRAKQVAVYTAGIQNSVENTSGRDGFFQRETVPAFAHSFLLSAVLSPDYVDVTGDGISDDDIGSSVKFNYSRVNKETDMDNMWVNQQWRTPIEGDLAHYNEGLKTDNADDKGMYTFGQKELWYLHSIESKNMVATFTVSDETNAQRRRDGKQVFNEDGGGLRQFAGQKKLRRIDLYTKAEYVRASTTAGAMPKPVKSVHFEYSYTLCNNNPANESYVANANTPNSGKLTLDSVWFSYNGNYSQGQKSANKYRFKYASGKTEAGKFITGNPDYNSTHADRWGTYKPTRLNPPGMTNADFPYTLQGRVNQVANNVYAGAWCLEKIQIPSGAVINVDYEADDYAFVQNKRAAQMTSIVGFAKDENSTPDNSLYAYDPSPAILLKPGKMDKRFVFFKANEPIVSDADILQKYLSGMDQILLKLWVEMPKNRYGEGYEPITVYSKIKRYGRVPVNNPDNTLFFVELENGTTEGSPIMETVLQFLRDYLPSKAYKGYDNGTDLDLQQFVSAIQGLADAYKQAVIGFENSIKGGGKCKNVDLGKSFARLSNPDFKKYGGGHRVKSIVISDNWKKMINPSAAISTQLDSYYGQAYEYTKKEDFGYGEQVLSSGVASYEPGIGNEENPFRQVLQYSDKQPLGPTNVNNIELPVAETFFPSPSVGYSKVSVRSIHHNTTSKKIKSGTGLTVSEFYTSRDFPVFSDYTDFDARSRVHYKPGAIMRFLFHQNKDFLTLTQGFRVMLNDMNGKVKLQATYPENDFKNPVSFTQYYYKQVNKSGNTYSLDNTVKVLSGADGVVTEKMIGRDVEIMNDFRDHRSTTRSAQIPLNVEGFTAGPIPIIIPSLFNALFANETLYRSATTLKVITDYGILDSVVNIDKGSQVSTKNMVYDGETGEVLITRTNNSFNKPVYNLAYPAHWVNSGMDQAYKNIDVTYRNVKFLRGEIKNLPPVDMANFESGDEVYVVDNSTNSPQNTTACIRLGEPDYLPLSNEFKLWALNIMKDDRNAELGKKMIFIDRNGNPYNAEKADIRIIRSGKRNMGSVAVGSVTSLSNPLVKDIPSGIEKITITPNNTNVLNASATEFKEKWRVQDAFYLDNTTVKIKRYVKIKYAFLEPVLGHSMSAYRADCHNCEYYYRNIFDPEYFLTGMHSFGYGAHSRRHLKSWLLFNLNTPQFSVGTVVKSARLNLPSHAFTHGETGTESFDHDFLYNNPHHNGYFSENGHGNVDPLSTSPGWDYWNNFKLSRMLSKWPWVNGTVVDYGQGTDYWNGAEAPGYFNQVEVSVPPPNFSTYNFTNANAIEVTGMVKGMFKDYFNPPSPALQYAPAIKISLLNTKDEEHGSRACFWGNIPDSYSPPPAISHGGLTEPQIELEYYNCNEALPEGVLPPNYTEYDSCITEVTNNFCLSVFSRQLMNPYVYGVLGNWKPWKNFVYYGERKESNPSNATHINTDGAIKDFESYWLAASSSVEYLGRSGSTKWVWNSEVTQFNRKGGEIENRDPLGRYNSGVYGYLETLPIAVANNARVREIAFDGFEDHKYKDELCTPICNPYKRHFKVGDISTRLSEEEAHTGNYSLKIPAATGGGSFSIWSNVLPDDQEMTPDIQINTNGVPFTDTVFVPSGTGLTRTHYNDLPSGWINNNNVAPLTTPQMPVVTIENSGLFSSKWEGVLQPELTGVYHLSLGDILDDDGKIFIDGQIVYSDWILSNPDVNSSVILKKGNKYTIKILYNQHSGPGYMQLRWKRDGAVDFSPVPMLNLYPTTQTAPTPTYTTSYCYKPDIIQSVAHNLIDSFSLIGSKRYLLSAWVREGRVNCNCDDYLNNTIQLIYNDNPLSLNYQGNGNMVTTSSATPTGNIIEGWQRYEFDFTIPGTVLETKNIEIRIKNNSSTKALYIDDLRILPYNSNLKSFVYDPVTLRLAAELDENNYASFYEYDNDGTLVRVKKETIKGIKTIQETRTGLQKKLFDF